MWLKLLKNIITFGGELRKDFKLLQGDYNRLHKAVHCKTNEDRLDKAILEKELEQEIKKANEARKTYESKPAKMIPIEYFNTIEPDYLRGVSEAYNSKSFRHFIYNVQQDIFGLLGQAGPDTALETLGMVKGMNFFIDRFHGAEKSYRDSMEPSNDGGEVEYD